MLEMGWFVWVCVCVCARARARVCVVCGAWRVRVFYTSSAALAAFSIASRVRTSASDLCACAHVCVRACMYVHVCI